MQITIGNVDSEIPPLSENAVSAESVAVQDEDTLQWNDVEHVAKKLFRAWNEGSELEWAQTAWNYIVGAGLAYGEVGREYCQARLRFLALATFYADWCSLAMDEEQDIQVEHHMEELNINPFYLGLLLGPDYDLDDDGTDGWPDERCAVVNALHELVRRERPILAMTLLKGFGGPSQLFISLWRSQYPAIEPEEPANDAAGTSTEVTAQSHIEHTSLEQPPLWILFDIAPGVDDEDWDDDEEEEKALLSDDEILNVVTAEKAEAWEWITDGCPPLG